MDIGNFSRAENKRIPTISTEQWQMSSQGFHSAPHSAVAGPVEIHAFS
jgi:hypothetical protein